MPRPLFTLLSACSLLLSLAALYMWFRSYWIKDFIAYEPSFYTQYILNSADGRVVLSKATHSWDIHNHPGWSCGHSLGLSFAERVEPSFSPSPGHKLRLLDFMIMRYSRGPGRFTWQFDGVFVPYWMLAMLFVLPPAIWITRSHRPRRRLQLGLCPTCGYDLRASKDRCPECGSPISPPSTAHS